METSRVEESSSRHYTAADDLLTVRSGGSVIDPDEAFARLRNAGFDDNWEVERNWDAPLRLVVGRRG